MIDNNFDMNVFKAAQQWQPSFPMVLDRIEGTWVVVGWTTDGDDEDVTLRLRVSFLPDEETVLFHFDVAPDGGVDFVQLSEASASCVCGHGIIEEAAPELWREEFSEMVRRWATVALILEPMDEYVSALAAARRPDGNVDSDSRSHPRRGSSEEGATARHRINELGEHLMALLQQEDDAAVILSALAFAAAAACDFAAGGKPNAYSTAAEGFIQTFRSIRHPGETGH